MPAPVPIVTRELPRSYTCGAAAPRAISRSASDWLKELGSATLASFPDSADPAPNGREPFTNGPYKSKNNEPFVNGLYRSGFLL